MNSTANTNGQVTSSQTASGQATPSHDHNRFLRFHHNEKHNGQPHEHGPNHHRRRKKAKTIAKHVLHDILATSAELIGTFLFLWIAFMGAQSATFNNRNGNTGSGAVTTQDNQTVLYIALSFGMSLLVVAWILFRVSGSAFNPAVTIALWLVGNITWRRALLIGTAQMVGGIAAAGAAKALSLGTFAAENALAAGILPRNGMAIEMFTTALLVFTVLMCAAEKSKSTFLAPVAIGLALFVGHLASISWTGAGINPARTFGPCVVNGQFPSYAWLYYVGQILGTIIATLAYLILKLLGYEEVVAGIESENAEDSQDVSQAPLMAALQNVREALPVEVPVGIAREGDTDGESIATSRRDLEDGPVTPGVEERGSHETAVTNNGTAQPKWIQPKN